MGRMVGIMHLILSSCSTVEINGLCVHVARKNVKYLRLVVCHPDGRVRVTVPNHVSDYNIQSFVTSKFDWIKQKQLIFKERPIQLQKQFVSGEMHYLLGIGYRMTLTERSGKHEVQLLSSGELKMFVRAGTSIENKDKLLNAWYRMQLNKMIVELLEVWQPIVGKKVREFGIKKMKTRWGTCNIQKRRIWLNLELIKKAPQCLTYVLVHELVHFYERHHNQKFDAWMTKLLPDWRDTRVVLNCGSLTHQGI